MYSGQEIVSQEECRIVLAQFYEGVRCFNEYTNELYLTIPEYGTATYDSINLELNTKYYSIRPVLLSGGLSAYTTLTVPEGVTGLYVQMHTAEYSKLRVMPIYLLIKCGYEAQNYNPNMPYIIGNCIDTDNSCVVIEAFGDLVSRSAGTVELRPSGAPMSQLIDLDYTSNLIIELLDGGNLYPYSPSISTITREINRFVYDESLNDWRYEKVSTPIYKICFPYNFSNHDFTLRFSGFYSFETKLYDCRFYSETINDPQPDQPDQPNQPRKYPQIPVGGISNIIGICKTTYNNTPAIRVELTTPTWSYSGGNFTADGATFHFNTNASYLGQETSSKNPMTYYYYFTTADYIIYTRPWHYTRVLVDCVKKYLFLGLTGMVYYDQEPSPPPSHLKPFGECPEGKFILKLTATPNAYTISGNKLSDNYRDVYYLFYRKEGQQLILKEPLDYIEVGDLDDVPEVRYDKYVKGVLAAEKVLINIVSWPEFTIPVKINYNPPYNGYGSVDFDKIFEVNYHGNIIDCQTRLESKDFVILGSTSFKTVYSEPASGLQANQYPTLHWDGWDLHPTVRNDGEGFYVKDGQVYLSAKWNLDCKNRYLFPLIDFDAINQSVENDSQIGVFDPVTNLSYRIRTDRVPYVAAPVPLKYALDIVFDKDQYFAEATKVGDNRLLKHNEVDLIVPFGNQGQIWYTDSNAGDYGPNPKDGLYGSTTTYYEFDWRQSWISALVTLNANFGGSRHNKYDICTNIKAMNLAYLNCKGKRVIHAFTPWFGYGNLLWSRRMDQGQNYSNIWGPLVNAVREYSTILGFLATRRSEAIALLYGRVPFDFDPFSSLSTQFKDRTKPNQPVYGQDPDCV